MNAAKCLILLTTCCLTGLAGATTPTAPNPFKQCLAELRSRAIADGINETTLEQVFARIRSDRQVLKADSSQPEYFYTFWDYLNRAVTEHRVKRGRELLERYQPFFANVEHNFGVRPEYLLALWGMETNYGSYLGRKPIFDALANLACNPRRADLFTREFVSALKIHQSGAMDLFKARGSWAGAMGHTQFLPSTYLKHALDYDRDGKRDIYGSRADALASAANYLKAIGWKDGERWGREVQLPENFDFSLSGLAHKLPVAEWKRLGVTNAFGGRLPDSNIVASLLLPAGHRGPAFLVYNNFHVTMEWNRSMSYALAVGLLADRIVGSAGLVTRKPPGYHRLSRTDVIEIQTGLAELGFDSGTIDGVVGRRTREATQRFQASVGLPADGFPDQTLLHHLRETRNSAN